MERLHVAERHLRVWILVWGSTSASLSTADMFLPSGPVRLLRSRLRDEDHPPQQIEIATSADRYLGRSLWGLDKIAFELWGSALE